MSWRKQPRMDEMVYVSICHSCGKKRIHKKHQGKTIYCPDCEIFNYNSSLMPYSIALSMDKDQ